MRMLLVAALLANAHASYASCAYVGMKANVLTRRDTHVPQDGGVLVGYTYGNDDVLPPNGPDPSNVKFVTNAKLERTQLAPGLSVYKFSDAKLDLGKGGSFTHDGKDAAITVAPAIGKLAVKTTPSFRSTETTGKATFTAAPPAEAVAIIAYDQTGTALLYATLPDTHDKLKDLVLFESGGHCGTPQPPTMSAVSHGGTYAFAYVDAFGRVGPKTKAQTY